MLKLYNRLEVENTEEEINQVFTSADNFSNEPSIKLSYFYTPPSQAIRASSDNNAKSSGVLMITIHKCANLIASPAIGWFHHNNQFNLR